MTKIFPLRIHKIKIRFLLIFLILTACRFSADAQLFYLVGGGGLFVFDGANCATCFLQPLNGIPQGFNGDVAVLPNGNLMVTAGGLLLIYALPDPNPIVTQSGLFITGTAVSPSGLVYMIVLIGPSSVLHTYDPATGVITAIGAIQPTFGAALTDLYFYNGALYASSSAVVLQVNITSPGNSIGQNSTISSDFAIAEEGYYIGQNFGQPIFAQFNPTNNQKDIICNLTSSFSGASLQQIPSNVPQPPLCCVTEAGVLSSTGPFNICGTATPFNGPSANFTNLDANDILRYILYTNPNNVLGSIIATSSTPTFVFNPATMQIGVTYYMAAIAGNNLNGNVDLNDPCLDFSNAAEAIWRPLPSVMLSMSNPAVCAGDCTEISAVFTGTPPFTLTYTAPGLGAVTQTFTSTTGSFQVCVPANAATGSFSIAATSVVDGFCSCQ